MSALDPLGSLLLGIKYSINETFVEADHVVHDENKWL